MYMLRMDVCVCVLLRCVCVCAHTTRVHKCVRVRARIEVYVCTHMGVARLGEVVAYDRERHRHEDDAADDCNRRNGLARVRAGRDVTCRCM